MGRCAKFMNFLNVLYWIILVLSGLGVAFVPTGSPNGRYIHGGSWLVLFIIIGIRVFKVSVE